MDNSSIPWEHNDGRICILRSSLAPHLLLAWVQKPTQLPLAEPSWAGTFPSDSAVSPLRIAFGLTASVPHSGKKMVEWDSQWCVSIVAEAVRYDGGSGSKLRMNPEADVPSKALSS